MDDYLVELESCRSEAPSITLETDLTSCPVCLIGEPKEVNRSTKSKIIVYTRDGTLLAEHKEKRCNNRNCRVGAYYGYIVIRGGDRIPSQLPKQRVSCCILPDGLSHQLSPRGCHRPSSSAGRT